MDKAILIVRTAKKGLCGKVVFNNNKDINIQNYKLSLDLNNKECEVLREQGQVKKIFIDGQELPKVDIVDQSIKGKQKPKSGGQGYRQVGRSYNNIGGGQSNTSVRNNRPGNQQETVGSDNEVAEVYTRPAAKAPYNFILLNKTVIPAEFQSEDNFPGINFCGESSLSAKHGERYNGYIEYELETITHFYIRDTIDDLKNYDDKKQNNPDFFSPGGSLKIPGSSLRGMVRTLVEVVSWSKFVNFDYSKLLYYRSFADQSLKDDYEKYMGLRNKDGTDDFKFSAGYLTKEGLRYKIIPAGLLDEGKTFKQEKRNERIEVKREDKFTCKKLANGTFKVISGDAPLKKRDWIIGAPKFNDEPLYISELDILEYENDENRLKDKDSKTPENKSDGDLLRQLEISEHGYVPCFYVKWKDRDNNDRVSFGHTGYFRLAYKKTIGEHVPQCLQDDKIIDIPEAIFGVNASNVYFASRVSFEDAEILPGQENYLLPEKVPRILSTPKPTTFQHYLEQNTDTKGRLKHWNTDALIRGYKFYWHRSNPKWTETGAAGTQHTLIKPVRPGVRFTGRIRFTNLSEVELGALLFVLDLPENCCYKMGMGKPHGLGSIKIKQQLVLIDREKRYESLFTALTDNKINWNLADSVSKSETFKNAFENYALNRIPAEEKGEAASLWDTKRLQQLKVMLDWTNTEKTDWIENTRYMEIKHPKNKNEFEERRVLRDPLNMI